MPLCSDVGPVGIFVGPRRAPRLLLANAGIAISLAHIGPAGMLTSVDVSIPAFVEFAVSVEAGLSGCRAQAQDVIGLLRKS